MPAACLRRVSVHADDVQVDLALPAGVAVASLLPSIADLLGVRDGHNDDRVAARYQLSRPGEAALDTSKTLAQHGIRDGSLLLFSKASTEIPLPSFHDPAEAVSISLAASARPPTKRTARLSSCLAAGWLSGIGALTVIRTVFPTNDGDQHGAVAGVVAAAGCIALVAAVIAERGFRDRLAGLTLGLQATGLMALAGLVAVPGSPGAPNALLASTAAAVTAVLVLHGVSSAATVFRTLACFAGFAALAALAVLVTGQPLSAIGGICVVISLALLEMSARLSVLLTGLSPKLSGDQGPKPCQGNAIRADSWLSSMTAAFAASAMLGGIGVALTAWRAGGSGVVGIVFATLTGALLLARARSHNDMARVLMLTAAGTVLVSASFAAVATACSDHVLWVVAAAVMLPAAPFGLQLLAPVVRLSPVGQRNARLLEYLGWAILVPLACWICGWYGAARAWRLP
ncbi:type VII secretion integral membrane protein EccD [Mycobacterium shimoidei]|uniref:type VII secretion integral membrane protein EccD n=1 Tax=Mycobacterium shimoidei TaxID=29313 RepID=UPI000DE9E71C|nr:type VII secretion integral membrane protein EccD [Mycobacterium shimoidei]